MKKELRTCCVCHNRYSFCPVCNPEDRKKPTWYFAYCSENCKDIYDATSEYENGRLSANDAKEKLNKLDLSKIENFGLSYKNAIEKINENYVPVEQIVNEDTDFTVNSTDDEDRTNKYYKKPKYKKVKNDVE